MREQIIDELDFEIMMAQKAGRADLIPGLERAIQIIEEMK